MAYRKFIADRIFDGREMLQDGLVLITDTTGRIEDIISENDAGGDLEEVGGILCPGFVNCHCHLELSHMKGYTPRRTGMLDFLLTVMKSRNSVAVDPYVAMASAEAEMTAAGIVAVGDICNTASTVALKLQGHLHYYNFIEATGFVGSSAAARFEQALEVLDAFDKNASVVPHAPYSVSKQLLDLLNAHDPTSLLTIHNQESHAENELFLRRTGDLLQLYSTFNIDISGFEHTAMTSLCSYLPAISRSHSMILVHNTVTSLQDLEWTNTQAAHLPALFWCLCPNANLYINGMLADVPMLIQAGCTMVVGTDSLAANDQLSIVEELKTLQLHFPSIHLHELLRWATFNGATALRINDRFGSFDRGMTPGVVLIEGVDGDSLQASAVRRLI